jgi:hypothetical protein
MAPIFSFLLSGLATIKILDGSNWPTWLLRITVLLWMNGLKAHITEEKPIGDKDWDPKEEIILGVLEIYTQKDI